MSDTIDHKPSEASPPSSLPYAVAQLLADYLAQAAEDLRTLREATTGETVGQPWEGPSASWPPPPPPPRHGGGGEATNEEEVYFSEEMKEIEHKLNRIEKVYEALRRAEGIADATASSSNPTPSASRGGDAPSLPILPGPSVLPQTPNPLARQVVEGLASLQSLFHKPALAPPTTKGTATPIKPLGRAVSLAEVGLHTLVRNTHTVFRKSNPLAEKRPRPSEAAGPQGATAATTTITRELSLQQRRERFGLYSARQPALLPRVDAVLAPYGVAASPARRLFTVLNGAAEAAFLQQRWRFGTKCALLREAPQMRELVVGYRQSLAEVDRIMAEAGGAPVTPFFYFQFNSEVGAGPSSSSSEPNNCKDNNNNGVVRINVQNGLFVDVTFDAVKGHWVVLALHWNVWQPAAAVVGYGSQHYSGAALRAPATATATGQEAELDAQACGAVPPYFRVLPARHAAMMELLGRQFREGGLARGCAAATQLLCAVCLDLLASQLEQLGLSTMHNSASDTALGGNPSSAVFSTDFRKGSYMVCRVVKPLVYEEGGPAVTSAAAAKTSLHLRMEVAGGTVLVERVWSSNALEKRYSCLLAPASLSLSPQEESGKSVVGVHTGQSPPNAAEGRVVLVDAEEFVWRNLLSHA